MQSGPTSTVKNIQLALGLDLSSELELKIILFPSKQIILRAAIIEHWHCNLIDVVVRKILQQQKQSADVIWINL